MRARNKLLVFAAIGVLAASACGDDGDTTTDVEPTEASATGSPTDAAMDEAPRTVTVRVDGEMQGSNVAFLGYFPRAVTVRAGDTIDFSWEPGDPHTVSFGSYIDEAFGQMAAGEEPTAFGKIPFAFSDAGDALLYGGALPCFTTTDPPLDGSPCEQSDQPAFDGTATLYGSGLLVPGDTFTVEIADDAAPGTYSYLCLLHGPDMSGSVTVVAADGDGQSAEEVTAAGDADLAAASAAADDALGAIAGGSLPGLEGVFPSGEGVVIAGGGVPEPVPVDILEFAPNDVTIAAGETVTWSMFGFHTISFDAPQDATPVIVPGDEGLPVLNLLAFLPQGGANGQPPPPEDEGPPPTEEPAPFLAGEIDGGTYDGAGFFSSGVVASFPPALFTYSITFSTPGAYPYQCLIHPDMEGSVTVT